MEQKQLKNKLKNDIIFLVLKTEPPDSWTLETWQSPLGILPLVVVVNEPSLSKLVLHLSIHLCNLSDNIRPKYCTWTRETCANDLKLCESLEEETTIEKKVLLLLLAAQVSS